MRSAVLILVIAGESEVDVDLVVHSTHSWGHVSQPWTRAPLTRRHLLQWSKKICGGRSSAPERSFHGKTGREERAGMEIVYRMLVQSQPPWRVTAYGEREDIGMRAIDEVCGSMNFRELAIVRGMSIVGNIGDIDVLSFA
jgi:hypothetical protein